jgi:HAD superfamily hydrolase (TIGR01509 family)
MLRVVIFDFNGIIVDDEPIHFELFRRVLAEEGMELTADNYYGRYLGFDDRGAFIAAYRDHRRRLDEPELSRLIERKAVYYQKAIQDQVKIFPGVQSLVATLSRTFPVAVASGALRHEIEAILATAGLLKHFAVIISAEDVNQGKPEPEIFLKALAGLNARLENGPPIAAADCLVIEDSKEGIRGALRAGMKCLAVTNSHPAELLKEANAVVRSLEEVDLSFLARLCA